VKGVYQQIYVLCAVLRQSGVDANDDLPYADAALSHDLILPGQLARCLYIPKKPKRFPRNSSKINNAIHDV
jgi:hypothetical protein